MGIFTKSESRIYDAPGRIARSLNNFDLQQPPIRKLAEALKLTKIAFESPAWRGDATAHFALPKYRVVIHVLATGASGGTAYVSKRRAAWLEIGWKFFGMKPSVIATCSPEQIAYDLKEILK